MASSPPPFEFFTYIHRHPPLGGFGYLLRMKFVLCCCPSLRLSSPVGDLPRSKATTAAPSAPQGTEGPAGDFQSLREHSRVCGFVRFRPMSGVAFQVSLLPPLAGGFSQFGSLFLLRFRVTRCTEVQSTLAGTLPVLTGLTFDRLNLSRPGPPTGCGIPIGPSPDPAIDRFCVITGSVS